MRQPDNFTHDRNMDIWKKIKIGYLNFLQGSHNHYSWLLPKKIGWFASSLLKIAFSGITFDDNQVKIIQSLPDDAIIVYVTKQKSYLERLFYYIRYRQLGLPCPEIGFFHKILLWQPVVRILRIVMAHVDYFIRKLRFLDPFKSHYIEKALTQGQAGFLALVETNEFYRRLVKTKTDPLAFLIAMQKRVECPIYLVPQLLFFETKPRTDPKRFAGQLMGTDPKPNILFRLFKLITKQGKVFAEVSEPVNLQAVIAQAAENQSVQDLALSLRYLLLEQITRHRRSITGPVIKSNEELKQHLLTSSRLQTYMKSYAKRRKMEMRNVHREALKYIDEIAAAPSSFFLRMAISFVDWLLNTMFEEIVVNQEGLLELKKASRKGPLILIPCHKSHIDYIVLSYLMVRNNMPAPHIFAGSNLAFWPMGRLLRWLGAFFVRRSFKGAVFYAKVFHEYVHMLVEEGFNIEVFIEGTRSRSGKLLLPKLGMIQMLLNSVKNGAADDLIFAPVFIGYDRVPEEASYLHELEGGEKEPENFLQFLRARSLLKKRFGKIYINFSEPISLTEFTAKQTDPIAEWSPKQINVACRDLGQHVFNAINRNIIVTPQALVSAAILNSSKDLQSTAQLRLEIDTYVTYLNAQQSNLSETIMLNLPHAVDHILNFYNQNKFINRVSPNGTSPEVSAPFKINPNKRAAMDYYKNSCIGYFIPAAFTATVIIANDSFQFRSTELYNGYAFLKDLFFNEFAHSIDQSDEYQIRKTLKAFIDDAILVPHPTTPDTYNITSLGFRKLVSFSGFLKPFLDSYWIVLKYFRKNKKDYENKSDRLKDIRKVGTRMYKQHEIFCSEALSTINYINAVEFFVKNGVRSAQDEEKIDFFSKSIRAYRQHWTR